MYVYTCFYTHYVRMATSTSASGALLRRAEPMPPSTSTAGTPSSAQSRNTAPLSPGAGEGSTTQEGLGSSLGAEKGCHTGQEMCE